MLLANIFSKIIKTELDKPKRYFFYWVNKQFNVLDVQRRKEIGPDLSCAEWILRNGGSVNWKNGLKSTSDYNELPTDNKDFHLNEVDASNTNIMLEGFEHFRGCNCINKLTLHKCYYIDNEALRGLDILKESLQILKISSCKNVTDDGILNLNSLKNLRRLYLSDLPGVKNVKTTVHDLQNHLPQCNIQLK